MNHALAALAGGFLWTLVEYLLHRFDGHGARGRTHFSREHLRHHAVRGYFGPTWQKAISGTLVVAAFSAAGYALVGLPGVSFALGFGVVYVAYEVIHRRLHTAAPLNAYGRWARRHHFYHHFADARRNHGVTTPLWDHVFRTFSRAETLRVPPRLAMDWLLDDAGAIRPQFVGDYQLGGRR